LSQARPPEVDSFAVALSEWLASFTMPESLAGEMADVCSGGAPWPAAIGGTAARRSGWGDAEALIWGIAVGGLAGGLEGVSASFASSVDVGRTPGTAVDGAAGTLLAADGLVAAAHEALGSLGPDRLEIVMSALAEEFGDGGPWGRLCRVGGVAWPAPTRRAPGLTTRTLGVPSMAREARPRQRGIRTPSGTIQRLMT
jgi:hypothetical protein